MRINRNNGIMETNPCKDYKQGQEQGLDHKDQDKDQDKDKNLTHKGQDKDLTPKDQDQDKDLKNVLKESLRTRTRTRINILAAWVEGIGGGTVFVRPTSASFASCSALNARVGENLLQTYTIKHNYVLFYLDECEYTETRYTNI